MDYLNNPENRDVKQIIDNYINNVNFEFKEYNDNTSDIKASISMIYYISSTSRISNYFEIYDKYYTDVEYYDDGNGFRILIEVNNQKIGIIYDFTIFFDNISLKIEDSSYDNDVTVYYKKSSWKIDYQTNKDAIDRMFKFFLKK